jgi:hypothetical protein
VIVDDGHDLRLVEIGEDHGIIRLEAVDVIDERLALVDVDKLVDELRERSVADRILKRNVPDRCDSPTFGPGSSGNR